MWSRPHGVWRPVYFSWIRGGGEGGYLLCPRRGGRRISSFSREGCGPSHTERDGTDGCGLSWNKRGFWSLISPVVSHLPRKGVVSHLPMNGVVSHPLIYPGMVWSLIYPGRVYAPRKMCPFYFINAVLGCGLLCRKRVSKERYSSSIRQRAHPVPSVS